MRIKQIRISASADGMRRLSHYFFSASPCVRTSDHFASPGQFAIAWIGCRDPYERPLVMVVLLGTAFDAGDELAHGSE